MTSKPDVPVPSDFPAAESFFALAGAQPKLSLVEEDGCFRCSSTSWATRRDQYLACESAAQDLARSTAADTEAWEKQAVSCLRSLRRQGAFSETQNLWLLRRVAELRNLTLPALPSPSEEYTMEITDDYLAELRSKQHLSKLEQVILYADKEYRIRAVSQGLRT